MHEFIAPDQLLRAVTGTDDYVFDPADMMQYARELDEDEIGVLEGLNVAVPEKFKQQQRERQGSCEQQ